MLKNRLFKELFFFASYLPKCSYKLVFHIVFHSSINLLKKKSQRLTMKAACPNF